MTYHTDAAHKAWLEEARWQASADAREAAWCEAAGRWIVGGWIALIVGLAGWMVLQ
jgi:hypothetical protein